MPSLQISALAGETTLSRNNVTTDKKTLMCIYLPYIIALTAINLISSSKLSLDSDKRAPNPEGAPASMASLRSDHSGSEATKDKQLSFADASHLRLPELSSESVARQAKLCMFNILSA